MTEVLSQFFTWAIGDVIFFSGDVQTTTIAMAITSSLCCSIVVAFVHIITLIRPPGDRKSKTRRRIQYSSFQPSHSKKYSPMWVTGGKVNVPCVKCGHYYADEGCRFVTCKLCCFSVLSCQVHQKKSVTSTPCDYKNTEMDLSSVGMQVCPDRLGFVGYQLTCLNLADNHLQHLPAEIGCLRGLQVLSLQQNKLSALPETIASLSELKCFDISHNMFEEFPEHIPSLLQLTELSVSHNQFTALPPSIDKLTNMLSLDISHNNINTLCEELFSLFQLKVLNLNTNPLEEIPWQVSQMVKLDTLDASSCQFQYLPSAIGECSMLTTLLLSNNRLTQLPSQIGQLVHLSKLDLDGNKLQCLPYTLSYIKDKLVLSVKDNPLLTETDYPKFTQNSTPVPFSFPSLKELTAREIIKQNIPCTQTLPNMLQEMLNQSGGCSTCGGPVCEFYRSEIVPVNFPFRGDWVPLYKQLCAPHRAQGCG